uniref:Replication protein A 70 kDa DNA-binding subunit B n=1 Tax=Tanacetum cinerariifolium TaxID=118510 RepID=A0A6L2P4E8_TANCI|nr:replication protein A 70 kDa DNA-binding subunit B [Tanacetum cinerariifolium]
MDGLIWNETGVDDSQRKLMRINHHQAVKEPKKQKLWYCKVHKALTASGVGIKQHGENYDDYFPDELNVLVGKRLLFRFHYTDDHINNNNHVYQVKMPLQDKAMITMFKKYFIIEEHEVDLQTPIPSNVNSSRFTNVESIPFKLDETPKSSYVATQGNASHEDEEAHEKRMKKVVSVKIEPKD